MFTKVVAGCTLGSQVVSKLEIERKEYLFWFIHLSILYKMRINIKCASWVGVFFG